MDQLVRGAWRGEICLNSIDTDGVRTGFDLEMLDAVAARVNVPIIASGGAGKRKISLSCSTTRASTRALRRAFSTRNC